MESKSFNPISIDIPNYSGPLEVLLDLAKTQKVDLAEISITMLADQFLEFIKENKDLNLETASEFLLMATWLAYLKSKLLLPEEIESNIEKILKEKTSNLLILTSDTHNIIEFNESSKNDVDNNKQRSFWELLQKK